MTVAANPFRIFRGSIVVSLIALAVAYMYGGLPALITAAILGVLEASLSFDNAIINSTIVSKLSDRWQKAFLTVGILVAVVGMRFLFPLLIVGVTTGLNPAEAWNLAMQKGDPNTPGTYGFILHEAHPQIAAFGGVFLLMLFLDYITDPEKELHWLKWVEERLVALGAVPRVAVVIGLASIIGISLLADSAHIVGVLVSGTAGMLTYLLVSALGDHFEGQLEEDEDDTSAAVGAATVKLVGKAALFSFIYLEAIDASFSFDSTIGAFAVTADPVLIAIGLGFIGAMFVRSLTIFLVRQGTLSEFVFLEHGAHWAIGTLSILLLASIGIEIPELVTGLIGVVLIGAALVSSIMYNRKHRDEVEDAGEGEPDSDLAA